MGGSQKNSTNCAITKVLHYHYSKSLMANALEDIQMLSGNRHHHTVEWGHFGQTRMLCSLI